MQKLIEGVHQFQSENFRPLQGLFEQLAKGQNPDTLFIPGPHRQRFTVEVAFYRSPAELDDCLATPVSGRRVVLYGGRGMLPPALTDMPDRVVRMAGVDPLKASVLAHAGLQDGDTLTVLLPDDWDGPPYEVLLEHARRWFSSPHSSEDDVHYG